jgi:Family of unknown function (DUF6345)
VKRTLQRPLLGVLLALLAAGRLGAVDRSEGGYAGTTDQGHDQVVYNFLKHFSYEQYFYARTFQWDSLNDLRVDAMDIAVFGGHGNRWFISTTDGGVDLSNVGSSADHGWGDVNAEFVAFESCDVVPSPLEVTDWWTNWIRTPGGAFDGVHQVLGFRTLSWQSTDQDVTDYFGARMAANGAVWQSWFDAINSEGRSDEMGAAVMHPSTDGDRYGTFVADPPKNHQSLRIWYQH